MKFFVDKKKYIKKQFEKQMGYRLNIDNPKTFNEKIQWLKLYYHNPLLTICADKYAVRDYIKKTIGGQYLIPLLGVFDNENEIDFDSLPNKYIIKTNNNSGVNIVCKNKKEQNIAEIKNKLKRLLLPQSNLYYFSYEWPYKNIIPKIIIEKFLEPKGDLIDYKFYCFNGQPKYILTASERQTAVKIDFYDLNWKLLPIDKISPHTKNGIKKPKNLAKMIKLAKSLSANFPFVRVDMYEVDNNIYIGELTFYPSAGMEVLMPNMWNRIFGDQIILPQKPNLFTRLVYQYL